MTAADPQEGSTPIQPANLPHRQVDQLLILRGVAALAVMLYHFTPPPQTNNLPNLMVYGLDLRWLLKPNGIVAVWIFFCLSGYLMGKAFFTRRYPCNQAGIRAFYHNRLLRIVPLTYFSILVTAIFVSPLIFSPDNLFLFVPLLTFTFVVSPANIDFWGNPPLWSLSTEMQFYLVVPLIFYAFSRLKLKRIFPILGLLAGIILLSFLLRGTLYLLLDQTNPIILFQYIQFPLYANLDIFLIGFLLNPILALIGRQDNIFLREGLRWLQKNQQGAALFAWMLIAGLFLIATYYVYVVDGYFWQMPQVSSDIFLLWPLVTALVTALFIFSHEVHHYPAGPPGLTASGGLPLAVKILETIGILSFGLYVWHVPVLRSIFGVYQSQGLTMNYLHTLLLFVLLTFLLSAASYWLLEKPMNRRKQFAK